MTAQLVISPEVEAKIFEVIDRATLAGRPYIFSYDQDCSQIPDRGDFHWQRQDEQLIGGSAEILITPTDGVDRFQSIKDQSRYWLEGAVGHPRFVGGFSFFDRPEAGIPRALFFLPRWLWSGQTHRLTLSVAVYPHDRLEVVTQKLTDSYHIFRTPAQPLPAMPSVVSIQELIGKFSWATALRRAMVLIEGQKLHKIVLARFLEVAFCGDICPYAVLRSLWANYATCTVFLLNFDYGGMAEQFINKYQYLVGASPELLLRSRFADNCHQFTTLALAGSMPRSPVAEVDRALTDQLRCSHKNLREHHMVINSICQSLTATQAQTGPIPEPQVCQLANVQHLYTPISGSLTSDDPLAFLTILQELHPTAAMAGTPRDSVLPLLRECEPGDRGWYAAPIGWFDGQGNCEFVVAIRSGYIHGDRAHLFAGSGIILDSDIEEEIRETNSKFVPFLQALGCPPFPETLD